MSGVPGSQSAFGTIAGWDGGEVGEEGFVEVLRRQEGELGHGGCPALPYVN